MCHIQLLSWKELKILLHTATKQEMQQTQSISEWCFSSVHTKIEGGLFWHYTLHPRIQHRSLLHVSWDDFHPCGREWSMGWVRVSESDHDATLLPSVSPRMPLSCPHLPSPLSLTLSPHVIRKKGWRVMAFFSSVGLAFLLSLSPAPTTTEEQP